MRAKPKEFMIAWAVVAVFALLPQVGNIGDYVLTLLLMLFIYIILAQSWNLLAGYTGQFNLGLAAYFGSGVLGSSMIYSAGVPLYVAMQAGGIISMLLAFIIGIPTLRLKGVYFAIGTLALAEAVRITVGNIIPTSVYMPATHMVNFTLRKNYYLGLGLSIITMIVCHAVVNSRIGFGLKAIRDDEEAAKATGVRPTRYKLLVFAISSYLVGLAGGVFGSYRGVVMPVEQFTPAWTFGPLVSASIGGLGTLTGPIWGSILFVILQEVFSRTLGRAHFIATGIIFILVVLFLPGGLVQVGVMFRRFLSVFISKKSESTRLV